MYHLLYELYEYLCIHYCLIIIFYFFIIFFCLSQIVSIYNLTHLLIQSGPNFSCLYVDLHSNNGYLVEY